jgi:hypothetical protein
MIDFVQGIKQSCKNIYKKLQVHSKLKKLKNEIKGKMGSIPQ